MNKIIPANPGFNALTFFLNEAGKPSYYREAVIAWQLRFSECLSGVTDDTQDGAKVCDWATPILPGAIGAFDEWDAIEDPNGTVHTIGNCFKTVAAWLDHSSKEKRQ